MDIKNIEAYRYMWGTLKCVIGMPDNKMTPAAIVKAMEKIEQEFKYEETIKAVDRGCLMPGQVSIQPFMGVQS